MNKISGLENGADNMTKYLGREDLDRHMEMAGIDVREGRNK